MVVKVIKVNILTSLNGSAVGTGQSMFQKKVTSHSLNPIPLLVRKTLVTTHQIV